MAQGSRTVFFDILNCISALFSSQIITEEEKNELVALAKEGLTAGYDKLYQKCCELPEHPIFEQLKETIIFQ